jgi:hypothetical protein
MVLNSYNQSSNILCHYYTELRSDLNKELKAIQISFLFSLIIRKMRVNETQITKLF